MAKKVKIPPISRKGCSYLRFNKSAQRNLVFLISFFVLGFAAIIYAHLRANADWKLTGFFITLLGSLLVIIKPTEQWIYRPWQAKYERQERHFNN